MNCKEYQQKILESLTCGEALWSGEISAHEQACAACREFHEVQVTLFRTMDSSLRAMVNQETPPSLLPGIRARLEQQPFVRRPWIYRWSFAAVVAAGAILALSLNHVRHRPEIQSGPLASEAVAVQSNGNPAPAAHPPLKSVTVPPSKSFKHAGSRTPTLTPSDAPLEVIVLAEERQAFARFVAELPHEPDVVLTLTNPAPPTLDAPVEIALLQIKSVDVKPLEATPSE